MFALLLVLAAFDPSEIEPDVVVKVRSGNGGRLAVAIGAGTSVCAGVACMGLTVTAGVANGFNGGQSLAAGMVVAATLVPFIIGPVIYIAPDVDFLVSEPGGVESAKRGRDRLLIAGATGAAAASAPYVGACAGCWIANIAGVTTIDTPNANAVWGVSSPTNAGLLAGLIGAGSAVMVSGLAGTLANAVILDDEEDEETPTPKPSLQEHDFIVSAQRY